MTIEKKEIRDKLRLVLMDEPYTWYDISYRIRYNAIDHEFDFEDIKQVKSTIGN